MNLILCADDRGGLLFHNRRLSRDIVLCQRILELCQGKPLWMNGYSASIFPGNTPNIRIAENFLEKAGAGDYCFVENTDISDILPQVETVILYRWNRRYPSDVKLPELLLSGRSLTDRQEFSGSSHPCITREVYQLCEEATVNTTNPYPM